MSDPNYVCTICSQTFTRRWRGSVHNKNFHGGLARIVRLVDYIVGRANGQFLPSDPSLFKRRNKWRNPNGISGQSVKDVGVGLGRGMEEYATLPPNDSQVRPESSATVSHEGNQRSTHSDRTQEWISKMAEIKRLTSRYLRPEGVNKILSDVRMNCQITGDNSPLDITLEEVRKKVRFKEDLEYLNKP